MGNQTSYGEYRIFYGEDQIAYGENHIALWRKLFWYNESSQERELKPSGEGCFHS
jgi:hypothetical protein